MGRWKRIGIRLAGVLLAALSLGSCGKVGQHASPLDPAPGVYKGLPVAELSPQTLAALDARARRQEFFQGGGPK